MMTGIPVKRMVQAESEQLKNMSIDMSGMVVGQKEAIQKVVKAIQRNRVGLKDPKKPVGTFIFLGPTGVGKTELARALAAFLFDDERSMIRIDMSEYQEKHTVARLVGEHDFAAFGQPTSGESTVRNMLRTGVSNDGPHIWIDLQASGFLYRMVRRIVGTLLMVGREELSETQFAAVLESADSNRAGPVVPPQGLCLTRVSY